MLSVVAQWFPSPLSDSSIDRGSGGSNPGRILLLLLCVWCCRPILFPELKEGTDHGIMSWRHEDNLKGGGMWWSDMFDFPCSDAK